MTCLSMKTSDVCHDLEFCGGAVGMLLSPADMRNMYSLRLNGLLERGSVFIGALGYIIYFSVLSSAHSTQTRNRI